MYLDFHAKAVVDHLTLCAMLLRKGQSFHAGRHWDAACQAHWKIHDTEVHARAATLLSAISETQGSFCKCISQPK